MDWNTENTGLVSRDEAQRNIPALAREEGIAGAFKVFYNDTQVVTPTDLPERVDMSRIRVSAVLDQA